MQQTLTREIRKEVINLANNCCECCGFDFYHDKRLRQIHHKNGNRKDNRVENLMCICFWCHYAHHCKDEMLEWAIEKEII